MTGPLAQQFAQVREGIGAVDADSGLMEGLIGREAKRVEDALAALSVIERHVQEMETALRPFAKAGKRLVYEGTRGYRDGSYDDVRELYRFRAGDVKLAWFVLDAGSSSGRTSGFGPGDEGSIPSLAITRALELLGEYIEGEPVRAEDAYAALDLLARAALSAGGEGAA